MDGVTRQIRINPDLNNNLYAADLPLFFLDDSGPILSGENARVFNPAAYPQTEMLLEVAAADGSFAGRDLALIPDNGCGDFVSVVDADNPSAWWRFGSDALLGDSVGTATLSATENLPGTNPAFSTDSVVAATTDGAVALEFDELTASEDSATSPLFPSDDFTVEGWSEGNTAFDYFVQLGEGVTLTYFSNDGEVQLVASVQSAGGESLLSYSDAESEEAVHVAVTRSGSENRLYYNGELVDADVSTGLVEWGVGNQDVRFEATDVALDEWAIYDAALSEQRIAARYDIGNCVDNGPEPVPDGLFPRIDFPSQDSNVDQGPITVRGAIDDEAATPLNVVFLADVATESDSGNDCNGDGLRNSFDDVNSAGPVGSSLDCQVASIIELNTRLSASPQSEDRVRVALAAYGGQTRFADLSPEVGQQTFVSPKADLGDSDRTPDLEQAAASLASGTIRQFTETDIATGTNLELALGTVLAEIEQRTGRSFVFVYVRTDEAIAPLGADLLADLASAPVQVVPIGIGSSTACSAGSPLEELAAALSSPCLASADPSDFEQLLANPPGYVTSVSVQVDNEDPVSAQVDVLGNFTANVFVASGPHTVQVAALLSDGSIETRSVSFEATLQTAYVHLGDSYAAGDGVEPYNQFPGPLGACFQSTTGYAELLFSGDYQVSAVQPESVALENRGCSAGQIRNITGVEQNKDGEIAPPQISALGVETDFVTAQVGGNDIGFGLILRHCLGPQTRTCFDNPYTELNDGTQLTPAQFVDAKIPLILPTLGSLYGDLRQTTGDRAPIVVLGYPALIEQDVGFAGNNCWATSALLDDEEREFIRSASATFNQGLSETASAVGVHFVDVFQLFEGHNACAESDEWIRAVVANENPLSGPTPSFHPNGEGHRVYADAVCGYVQGLIDADWPVNEIGLPQNPGEVNVAVPDLAGELCTRNSTPQSLRSTTDNETPAETQSLELSQVELTPSQVDEIERFEFGEANLLSLGAFNGTPSCTSEAFPTQQVVVQADGYEPGTPIELKVRDSSAAGDRTVAAAAQANENGSVTISFIVPSDVFGTERQVLIVDLTGTGALRNGTRITGAIAELSLDNTSPCRAELEQAGELSIGGDQAPAGGQAPPIVTLPAGTAAPVAEDDSAQVLVSETVDLDVLDNDTDPDDDLDEESLTVISPGVLGLAEVVNDDDGVAISYTAAGVAGTDSFTYEVCDDAGLCDTATVSITVMALSDCTILGTSGSDTLNGTAGDDVICGRGGNDTINGRGGNDIIFGNRGADTIDGGGGDDTIYGGRGADTIRGQSGDDVIRGGRGSDNLEGNGGDDVIRGGNGTDTISGGNGSDTIYSGKGNDTINGDAGNDTIRGLRGSDTLNGGRGADTIYGGRGADTINGQAGDDTLFGRRGRDVLNGGAGNDIGYGGRGVDTCNGIETAYSC